MTTRRLAVVALVFLIVCMAVVVIVRVTGQRGMSGLADDAEEGVDGYPQRIGFERPSDRLPDRPGALAATFYDNDFGVGRQLGVSSTGRLWELTSFGAGSTNVLSRDGRLLLTGPGRQGSRLLVHDLSRGGSKIFGDITDSLDSDDRTVRFHLDVYGQVHWSADASKLLAGFSEHPRPGRFRPRLLDVATGTLTRAGRGQPAGFRTPSEVVSVHKVGGGSAPGGIVMTITDVATALESELPLRLTDAWRGDRDGKLTASVSPDGKTLLLIEIAKGANGSGRLRLFSTNDGTEQPSRAVSHWDGGQNCPTEWLRNDPVLPSTSQKRSGSDRVAGLMVVTDQDTKSLVAVHHRLQSSCLHVAEDALMAGPNRALFGTSTYVWTWYWKPLLIVGSIPILGFLLWSWRRRRATRAE